MKKDDMNDIFENLDDDFLEQLYDYYDDKYKDTPDPVTPELDAKMKKLFAEADRKKQLKRTKKRALKTVAVIALVMIVSSASILSVDAWRVRIFNMWITFGDARVDKQTQWPAEEMAKIPAGTAMPAHLTEGYKLYRVSSGSTKTMLFYKNDADNYLTYGVYPSDNTIYGKTSENENAVKTNVNGWEGYYLANDAINSLVWHTNDHIYRVTGSIDEREIMKIAESVK